MLAQGLTLVFRRVKTLHRLRSCGNLASKAVDVESDFGTKFSSFLLNQRRGYARKTILANRKEAPPLVSPPVEPAARVVIPANPQFVLFEERTVAWKFNDRSQPNTLKFRVTYYGIDNYNAVNSSQWSIDGRAPIIAPFFNRDEVLLDMLRGLYYNLMQRGTFKPKYSIQMLTPGSGKTRMLTEWVMQAFANRKVIDGFLANTTDTQTRRKFLNTLYQSAYKQHTILSYGRSWVAKSTEVTDLQKALVDVVIRTILSRHSGQSIEFKGRLIQINPETAKEYFGLQTHAGEPELTKLVALFVALADITYEDPEVLPFPQDGLLEGKCNVFFCIDECQTFSERFKSKNKTDGLYLLFRDVAARSQDLMEQNGISPFWFAVGTHLPGRFFDIEGNQSQFDIIVPSLSNLLDVKYLVQICKQYLNYKLPSEYCKDDTSTLPELPNAVAKALVRNYLKTFGNPRAVERLIFAALTHLSTIPELTSHDLQKRIDRFDKQLDQELLTIFAPTTLTGPQKDIARLSIAAAFCCDLAYDDPIRGLKVAPKALVSSGYLSVWRRQQPSNPTDGLAKYYFTHPFFTFTAAGMEKEVLHSQVQESEYWTPYHISLASLVLEKDCADYLMMQIKGESFEKTVASLLYARYVLALKKRKDLLLSDIFPAKNIPAFLRNVMVKLNGVVKLKKHASSNSRLVLDAIKEHKVIAIDVGNSKIADVLLPITIPGSEWQVIVGFQCNKYAGKPPLQDYLSNCETSLSRGIFFVGIAPVQHANKKFISQLSNEARSHAFLAEASELVSPLYLVGMSFVPQNPAPLLPEVQISHNKKILQPQIETTTDDSKDDRS